MKDVSAICSKALVLHPLTAFTDCISERILVGITTYPSRNAGKRILLKLPTWITRSPGGFFAFNDGARVVSNANKPS